MMLKIINSIEDLDIHYISSITALLIGLTVILAIMSVSTFKTDVIQYLLKK